MNHAKTLLHLLSATSVLAMAVGCSTTPTTHTLSDAESCSLLNKVIAQSATGFEALKGTRVTDYDHSRWDTAPIMTGANCDVISWGTGNTNFACTWDQPAETAARNDYTSGLKLVTSCLGASWAASSLPGSNGEGQRFSKLGENAVVDVRVYPERPPSTAWQTSVTVGSAINRNAR